MESKKLSFNPKYILREFLTHWPIWAGVICIYLLTITGLIGLYSYYDNSADYVTRDVIRVLLNICGIMSFVMGLVAADSAFGYLGSKKKHYFFDVLPMNRLSLFTNRFIFGYLLMFFPNLIIFFVEIIQIAAISGELVIAPLACWLLIAAAQNLFWLAFGSLFMVLCGRKLMAGFLYIAFSFFGYVIEFTLAMFNSIMFIGYGLTISDYDFLNIGIFSPFEYMYRYTTHYEGVEYYSYGSLIPEGAKGIEGYFGVSRLLTVFLAFVIILIITYLLYARRKAERTGDNIVFPFMKKVFSWCFTLVFTLEMTIIMLGLFVSETEGMAHYPGLRVCIIVMILAFGFAGYMISGMIIEKKFQIFKKYIFQTLVCSGVIAIFFVVYMHDIFCIEKYVPDVNDISSVRIYNDQFTNKITYYDSINNPMSEDEKEAAVKFQNIIFNNMDEIIENYKTLDQEKKNQETLNVYEQNDPEYEINHVYEQNDSEYEVNRNIFYINFFLKSGKEISRSYYIKPEGKLYNEIKTFISEHSNYFSKNDTEVNYYFD